MTFDITLQPYNLNNFTRYHCLEAVIKTFFPTVQMNHATKAEQDV